MNNFFNNLKCVHFVGVGGVSMSKLCAYTASLGIVCSGSDLKFSPTIKKLEEIGVKIKIGTAKDFAKNADLVVFSSAIKNDNPDLVCAKRKMERKDYLAEVAKNFDFVVAISGAHGKTTATSMLAWVLKAKEESFTAHIGGNIVGIDNFNFSKGNKYFITEACEYSKSFLKLSPDIGVVLNVDYDHPDCYKSLEDTYLAFAMFALKSKIFIYNNNYKIALLNNTQNVTNECISYGKENANYTFCNCEFKNGCCNFDVKKDGKFFDSYTLYTLNQVNIYCAIAVIAVADRLGVEKKYIKLGLATFPGLENRFQCLGMSKNGLRLIVDYAHHPEQIKQAIAAAQKLLPECKRLFVVFEPHTYSRTKALLNDFVTALNGNWTSVIMPTYSAREKESAGFNSIMLYQTMCKECENAVYVDGYKSAKQYLLKNGTEGDIALFLGAGLDSSKILF